LLPNSLMDDDYPYMLTLSLKEKILYSQQVEFNEDNSSETISIGSDQIDIPNGGVL